MAPSLMYLSVSRSQQAGSGTYLTHYSSHMELLIVSITYVKASSFLSALDAFAFVIFLRVLSAGI